MQRRSCLEARRARERNESTVTTSRILAGSPVYRVGRRAAGDEEDEEAP
jgi:hypothetical protein